ncbi:AraC-type DNA-binding protein [Sunxiuqinia elliptica]|uniref:AraC-type DNA-binding protein n=1 Tax=Sunxiuqinia elliptica TaxID=655355 RepID=A0A1I2JVJ7_9BACT|nr:AraC-type DNA-binding protein [Sunxiuqinia elliptica]
MHIEKIGQSINFQLRNIALLKFSTDSHYNNIVSPFTRLYLITKGTGLLVLDSKKYELTAGHMYLVPSFAPCSYFFHKDLAHYYIHFSMEMPSGLTPYNLYSISKQVEATALDEVLFQRCVELNPGSELPHHDPNVYQSKPWVNKQMRFNSMGHYLETTGIIRQLFSRFICDELNTDISQLTNHNMQVILKYIQENIANEIPVIKLAEIACLSKDHFTRLFKSITGLPPSEFIILKRIEKAKLLLLTTDYPLDEIITQTGFKTSAYFCRIFKQWTSYTPMAFRKNRE